MTEPKSYKIDPKKLAKAPQYITPYLFLGAFYYTENYEYFDVIKPYLDIPEEPKGLEFYQKEIEEKFEELLVKTKRKFAVSKETAEYYYNQKFDRINDNFEYAKKHGEFIPKLIFIASGLSSNTGSYGQSFVIKQGSKHEGYYTIGNRRYFKYYMPDKPNAIVRFFMKVCLGFWWVDEKNVP
jgi:hypothetical protein